MFEKMRATINQPEVRMTWQKLTRTDKVNVNESERFYSLLAGSALAAAVLKRCSIGTVALMLASGYLLYRGLTGHCPAYEAGGISTASRTERLQFRAGDKSKYRLRAEQTHPDAIGPADKVEETGLESFPASDPPAWTSSRGA